MKKKIITLFAVLGMTSLTFAQGFTFHGGVRNSLYSFERKDTHTRMYQTLHFSAASDRQRMSLNGSMRMLSDLGSGDAENRFRAYSLFLQFRDVLNKGSEIRLGRQFLHPGTVLGSLDGAFIKLPVADFGVHAYAGNETDYLSRLDESNPSGRLVLGGMIDYKGLNATRLEGLFLHKTQDDQTLWQIVGLNAFNRSVNHLTVNLQAHYDTQNERLHRLYAFARHKTSDRLRIFAGYKAQYPQIYADSYFTIFQIEKVTQLKLGASYEILPGYNLSGQIQQLAFENDSASRLLFDITSGNGSLGFIYESGYAGDQVGVMFDYGIDIINSLMLSMYVDYSKYRAVEIYEYDNQLANALRLSYSPGKRWSVDVEYQWLQNRFKEQDSRFLNHLSYRW
jgi:hypothetical protein